MRSQHELRSAQGLSEDPHRTPRGIQRTFRGRSEEVQRRSEDIQRTLRGVQRTLRGLAENVQRTRRGAQRTLIGRSENAQRPLRGCSEVLRGVRRPLRAAAAAARRPPPLPPLLAAAAADSIYITNSRSTAPRCGFTGSSSSLREFALCNSSYPPTRACGWVVGSRPDGDGITGRARMAG